MTESTVILDSWGWIAYFQADSRARRVRELIEGPWEIKVSTVNIVEVHTYLLRKKQHHLLPVILERSHVIPVDEEIALEAAILKVKHKLGIADAIVLATARKHDITLVTGDSDFKKMENVVYLGK